MQKKPQQQQNIVVLGAGHFGTCLSQHLARQGHEVCLWGRDQRQADSINRFHINPLYLSHVQLSGQIQATTSLEQALEPMPAVIVAAIPAQSLRQVFSSVKRWLGREQLLVCAAKGIEAASGQLPSGVAKEVFGSPLSDNMVSLSGPSFAVEIAENQPTGVAVASFAPDRALRAQQIFHSPRFRAYTSDDPVGLEVAGALKNVIAIAAGACAGLGFQANSRATLITRGLAEMTRIGVALGANPLTFNGLGGVGDLFLTCSSEKSRNFTVGFRLGQGEKLDHILKSLGSVAEGVATSQPACNLARKTGVMAPITEIVFRVLHEGIPIGVAVETLMNREAKPEISFS